VLTSICCIQLSPWWMTPARLEVQISVCATVHSSTLIPSQTKRWTVGFKQENSRNFKPKQLRQILTKTTHLWNRILKATQEKINEKSIRLHNFHEKAWQHKITTPHRVLTIKMPVHISVRIYQWRQLRPCYQWRCHNSQTNEGINKLGHIWINTEGRSDIWILVKGTR
jgi:hypothetical protein